MKNILLILLAAVVLTSCKSNAFLRQRYTNFSTNSQRTELEKPIVRHKQHKEPVQPVPEMLREETMIRAFKTNAITEDHGTAMIAKRSQKAGKKNHELVPVKTLKKEDVPSVSGKASNFETKTEPKPDDEKWWKRKGSRAKDKLGDNELLMLVLALALLFVLIPYALVGGGDLGWFWTSLLTLIVIGAVVALIIFL